ncbi:MAG TPA: hypothetical protein VNW51_10780 [Mucilaginibacter sp.]|nr:hypothetical protein [Mucilaginibacter sp.]
MKNLLTFITCFFCLHTCLAQETVEKKNNIIDDVYERYKAKIDSVGKQTIIGPYTAYIRRKPVAQGQYVNGKRVGVWYYYDANGKLMQQFDYDKNQLLFEAPVTQTSTMHYQIDYPIADSDRITIPVKIGGRYFGYLPYALLIRKIHRLRGLDTDPCRAVLNILVSPMGRLADCTVVLNCAGSDPVTFNVETDGLPIEEKIFAPATYNGKPIASKIEITCHTNDSGEMSIN